jgi:hypothetical protein
VPLKLGGYAARRTYSRLAKPSLGRPGGGPVTRGHSGDLAHQAELLYVSGQDAPPGAGQVGVSETSLGYLAVTPPQLHSPLWVA